MHFRCNLRCEHCMIEGTMDRLRPSPMSLFWKILEHNVATRRWKGIILTGAEVTLREDLPELALRARDHGFEHVRIQTHGMRLSDTDYCASLVDSGVDEFFVSITAASADSHDAITQTPGSFLRSMKALENLDRFAHVRTMTNTVVTRRSYQQLPGVVGRTSHLERLVQMDFWNYWPMSETDERSLLVDYTEVAPYLRTAISEARRYGRSVEVKNFPECLLGEDADALDNNQPELFIDRAFWREFDRNGFQQCMHRPTCESKKCLGLNTAYIEKFGWQASQLSPI